MHAIDAFVRFRRTRLLRLLDGPAPEPPPYRHLPKRLWLYWDKGEAAAPALVRFCIDSWRRTNPRWRVTVLDDASLSRFADLADVDGLGLTVQKRSNLLRLRLLARHGGVWSDATVLCTAPLDGWLPLAMQTDAFLFSRPGPDRPVSSWFMASHRDGPLLSRVERTYGAFLRRNGARGRLDAMPYYGFHYTLDWMLRTDRGFRRDFARMPVLSAAPPHRLKRRLARGLDDVEALARGLRGVPVHKLTWRRDFDVGRLAAVADRLAPRRPETA